MSRRVEIMSNIDKFWLHMDHPTNLMIITGYLAFDEPLDFQRLLKTFEKRLLCYERFKKRVIRPLSGIGNATWELDPKFDLRSHLHRVALPSPGDKETLQELISDLTATPLDPTKPLWQAHYIENYNNGGSVLFCRIHHCIADGIALIRLLLSMADLEPDANWSDGIPEKKGKQASGLEFFPSLEGMMEKFRDAQRQVGRFGKLLAKELEQSISNPAHVFDRAKTVSKYTFDAAGVISKILLLPADRKTVFRGQLGVRKSVSWSNPLPLDDIKNIGKYFNATINDILVSMVTGALRRYLQQCNNLVGDLDIRMAMPVNIRPLDAPIELGNQFSLVLVSLPVHIDDPVLRIREIQRRIRELKDSPDALVAYTLLNVLGVSSTKLAKFGATMFANKMTGVMSNVPGPRQPLYFAGKEITDIMFWVPRIGGLGLGISIISYNGKVSLGICTDTGLVADPNSILRHFENEFRMLHGMYKAGQIERDPLVINDRFQDAANVRDAYDDPAYKGAPVQAIRCNAMTQKGTRCQNRAATDSIYCTMHLSKYESLSDLKPTSESDKPDKTDQGASAG